MKDVMIDSFWATSEQLAVLIVPIVAVYLIMNLIAELVLGRSR